MKTNRPSGKILLTSDDVNVLSMIAQQSELPEKFLLKLVDELELSSDARKVAIVLIQNRISPNRTSATAKIASQFAEWARSMSESSAVDAKLAKALK